LLKKKGARKKINEATQETSRGKSKAVLFSFRYTMKQKFACFRSAWWRSGGAADIFVLFFRLGTFLSFLRDSEFIKRLCQNEEFSLRR
jgi:hypothetical protein